MLIMRYNTVLWGRVCLFLLFDTKKVLRKLFTKNKNEFHPEIRLALKCQGEIAF